MAIWRSTHLMTEVSNGKPLYLSHCGVGENEPLKMVDVNNYGDDCTVFYLRRRSVTGNGKGTTMPTSIVAYENGKSYMVAACEDRGQTQFLCKYPMEPCSYDPTVVCPLYGRERSLFHFYYCTDREGCFINLHTGDNRWLSMTLNRDKSKPELVSVGSTDYFKQRWFVPYATFSSTSNNSNNSNNSSNSSNSNNFRYYLVSIASTLVTGFIISALLASMNQQQGFLNNGFLNNGLLNNGLLNNGWLNNLVNNGFLNNGAVLEIPDDVLHLIDLDNIPNAQVVAEVVGYAQVVQDIVGDNNLFFPVAHPVP